MIKKLNLDRTSKLIKFIISLLAPTWRYEAKNEINSKMAPGIFATWHEYILPLAFSYKSLGVSSEGISCIASASRDGKRLAAILQDLGITTILGSPRRGGISAIRDGIRELRKGQQLVLTPDGPKGPRRELKGGIAQISIKTNIPIVPIRFYPKNYWRLSSWDKFVIPKPFSKIVIEFGDPIFPDNYKTKDDSFNEFIDIIKEAITPIEE